MNIRELTFDEIKQIYNERILSDFPRAEIKPFSVIKRLYKKNLYFCFGLFEEGVLRAYAFLVKSKSGSAVMIDYFAVISGNRGAGYGSQFMPLLKQQLSGFSSIIIEVESRRSAKDATELEIRERRISFYVRNGYLRSRVMSRLFGVDYEIMTLPIDETLGDESVYAELNALYDTLFPPRLRKLFSHIEIEDDERIEKLPRF